ncbi:putative retrotransposon hot spot protein (RHS) [Trypanosoma cruzi]|uniref:Putative retrotransposon hot spot protein (RHS) n=1 Tax=Trypanosoma cruzi TaxID=5693 RepID=A0A2V2US18_TRYCR|nr:putative retrotransposon hot spot protein (RHS) [Trypanosoma cruzi]
MPVCTSSTNCCTAMRSSSQWLRTLLGTEHFCLAKSQKRCQCTWVRPVSSVLVDGLPDRGFKGYIIYDVALACRQPAAGLPCKGWGHDCGDTTKQKQLLFVGKSKREWKEFIINCLEENNVKAMCAWIERNQIPQKQAKYWKEVNGCMNKVGPNSPLHFWQTGI